MALGDIFKKGMNKVQNAGPVLRDGFSRIGSGGLFSIVGKGIEGTVDVFTTPLETGEQVLQTKRLR